MRGLKNVKWCTRYYFAGAYEDAYGNAHSVTIQPKEISIKPVDSSFLPQILISSFDG